MRYLTDIEDDLLDATDALADFDAGIQTETKRATLVGLVKKLKRELDSALNSQGRTNKKNKKNKRELSFNDHD